MTTTTNQELNSRSGSKPAASTMTKTTAEDEEVTPLTAATFQSGAVESWPRLENGGFLAPSSSSSSFRRREDGDDKASESAASSTSGADDSDNNSNASSPSSCRRPPCHRRFLRASYEFYEKFDFPIHVLLVILIAYLYPPLGAVYVAPNVTANWVAVCYIFALFGLGVKTEEFASAFAKMPFNALIQIYNLGFISAVTYGITRLLALGVLTQTLADGLAICACLPMSINVGIILTMAAGGDEAVAIFHTTFGNFMGVFLSPALILGYLGTAGYFDIGQVYTKLSLIAIVPLVVGQLVQRLVPPIADFYFKHKPVFKKTAEWALVFIIYTIFSENFYKGSKVPIGQVFVLIACIICFILGFMAFTWQMLRILYRDKPVLRVTGTLISIQKTISLGVPLITAIYGGNPNLTFYTLPVMIWHPLQLILGSIIVPSMAKFLAREKERLAALDDDGDNDVEMGSSPDEASTAEAPGTVPSSTKRVDDGHDDDDDDPSHQYHHDDKHDQGSTSESDTESTTPV